MQREGVPPFNSELKRKIADEEAGATWKSKDYGCRNRYDISRAVKISA
jgi:hypothetical protein